MLSTSFSFVTAFHGLLPFLAATYLSFSCSDKHSIDGVPLLIRQVLQKSNYID
jgi:hypothetical protein